MDRFKIPRSPNNPLQIGRIISENTQDALSELAQRQGLNLLETLPPGAKPELQHLIQANQKRLRGQESLLSLLPKSFCPKDAGSEVEEIIVPYVPGEPGSSNREKESDKPPMPRAYKASTILARLEVVAATIYVEQAQDKGFMHHIINGDVVREASEACERQLIKGNGNAIKGLLHDSHGPIARESEGESGRERLCLRAHKEYKKITGRQPSLIVLPNEEMFPVKHRMRQSTRAFPDWPSITPIVTSDFLPDNLGLLLAADEIVLASSSPTLTFQYVGNTPWDREQINVIVSCNIGLLVARSKTLFQLGLD